MNIDDLTLQRWANIAGICSAILAVVGIIVTVLLAGEGRTALVRVLSIVAQAIVALFKAVFALLTATFVFLGKAILYI